MTFEEWWETVDKDFSDLAIPDEIKWFSEKAWNKAVNVMIEQEEKSTTWNGLGIPPYMRMLEDY